PGLDFAIRSLADADPAVADAAEKAVCSAKVRPEDVVPRLLAFGLTQTDGAVCGRVVEVLEAFDKEAALAFDRLRKFEFRRVSYDPLKRFEVDHLVAPFVLAHLNEMQNVDRNGAYGLLRDLGESGSAELVLIKMLEKQPDGDDFWREAAARKL